eukprot:Sspe_Gene.16427::Locus_5785_Transcript_1_1_Confidence_1.000_Length_419::g.16427::m.16427
MVFTHYKCLRLPFFMARFFTRSGSIPAGSIALGFVGMTFWQMKYQAQLDYDYVKKTYLNGYPEARDPLMEQQQKYAALHVRQHGIDITDPVFTGVSKQELARQMA